MIHIRSAHALAAVGTALWLLGTVASAEMAAFEVSVDGENRRADVPVVLRYGVEYLPLNRLVEQFGGAADMGQRRMSIDLNGTRAWVQMNDKRVQVLNSFQLRQPVRQFDDAYFIAHVDIEEFFQQAFRLNIRPAARSLAPNPALNREEPAEIETLDNVAARREARRTTIGSAQLEDRPIEVILIDPGHGGRDTGVLGPSGALEKDVTLMVGGLLRDLLRERVDAEVVMTREEDLDLNTQQRALLAARHEADFVITLHAGGSISPLAEGAAIFFPPADESPRRRYSITSANVAATPSYRDSGAQSQDIATVLADAIEAATGISLRGVYEAPCKLLSRVAVPGVLLEVGCLTNPVEEVLLQNPEAVSEILVGIADAIESYLEDGSADGLEAAEPSLEGQD